MNEQPDKGEENDSNLPAIIPGEGVTTGTPATPRRRGKGKKTKAEGSPAEEAGPRKKTAAELREEERERRREEEGKMLADWASFNRSGWDWRENPTWPTEKDREQVSVFSFAGFTQEQIAAAGGCSVETLRKHFEYELDHARMMIIGDLASRAIYRAREGDAAYTLFLLKTRGGFHENPKGAGAAIDQLEQEGVLTPEQRDTLTKTLVQKIKIANKVQREERAAAEAAAKQQERPA